MLEGFLHIKERHTGQDHATENAMDHNKKQLKETGNKERHGSKNHNKIKTRVQDTTKINGQDSCITVKFPEVRATTM